jgi:hypothetical protein
LVLLVLFYQLSLLLQLLCFNCTFVVLLLLLRVSNESGVQRFVLWWLVERRWRRVEEGFRALPRRRWGDEEKWEVGRKGGEERLLEWCEMLLRYRKITHHHRIGITGR